MKDAKIVWVAIDKNGAPILVCTVEGLCEDCADQLNRVDGYKIVRYVRAEKTK